MKRELRQVVVTGIGIVSSLGNDLRSFWNACLEGRSVVAPTPANWHLYYDSRSAHWSPLVLPDYAAIGLRRSDILSFDPAALNAIFAAEEALRHSGCEKVCIDERAGRHHLNAFDSYRCGAYIGTGLGCITSTFQNYVPHLLGRLDSHILSCESADSDSEILIEIAKNIAEQRRVLPVASTKCMANAISALISIRYGFRGQNETCIAACAAGTTAIARAYEQVSQGRIDFAVAGGTEYYGDRAGGVFMAFDRLNTLAKPRSGDTCVSRPFDIDRTGFLFSQGGACMLTIESLESARNRGATVLATIKGSCATSDAYSLAALSPDCEAIRRMIDGTLLDASIAPAEVDYVNAHGTGTVQNDEIEAAILERAFPHGPYVNSTKSLLGHTIGACGAIEAAVAVLGVQSGELHPSINLESPVRDLNFVRTRTFANIRIALTHNFGFGGHNVGLVFGRD